MCIPVKGESKSGRSVAGTRSSLKHAPSFSMLSKGVRIWPDDLVQSPTFCQPVMPCIIHTTCSPERADIIAQQIDNIREKTSPDWSPGLIWEILPVREKTF